VISVDACIFNIHAGDLVEDITKL